MVFGRDVMLGEEIGDVGMPVILVELRAAFATVLEVTGGGELLCPDILCVSTNLDGCSLGTL